ncbi:hypothetical protein [Sulfurivermis fontis]|uniref:hypothetical protein n=1 Tax=Sulfurivermis fontis TaxID=1972068 RepID=UPI000FDCDA46|nr:hypothetical protein [Sulfurivermis fontis]
MKYLQLENESVQGEAECASDAIRPKQAEEARLAQLEAELASLPADAPLAQRLTLRNDIGYILLDLERNEDAWHLGHDSFRQALAAELWEQAVQGCDIVYQSEKNDAIKALAHGVWLAVTYPIDPELSVLMLKHLVEETPPKADAAAIPAAVAAYLVELRAEGKKREDLKFFTAGMLAEVAKKHSEVVDNKEIFDFWVERLELNDPAKLLPRLGKLLDVLVPDAWWYDRDLLRSRLPAD